jgi:DNA-binding FadR family transcriptional regulator
MKSSLAAPPSAALAIAPAQSRTAAVIAAQLRAAILNGAYILGDRLPPERDIARQLGASRSTVRNALQLLEDDELVTRKPGSGTYVAQNARSAADDVAEITSPLELVEVRAALEPRMVRLAVLNAKPRDLDRLWEALEELERTGSDADRFSRCDQQLHLALARATHNPLIVWIYQQVNRIRSHPHWVAVQPKVLTVQRIAAYNAEHRALVEAISVRDGEQAAQIMQAHLQAARQHLLGVHST